MTASTHGNFIWFELLANATDLAKAAGFYGETFGWTTEKMPMGPGREYTMLKANGVGVGGFTTPPNAVPNAWLSHLAVADAEATAAKVIANGGKVMMKPMKMGDVGTMAVVTDPAGAAFALWQATKPEPKAAPANGHFVWNELTVGDPARTCEFYQAIAGLGHGEMDMGPMGTYHLLKNGDVSIAGVTKPMMPGVPTAWLPYVQVANADATAAKATKLGATVKVPPTDIPGVGRFAIFVDPIGAGIGILQAAS